ncbi:hypothetical protein YW3DRAFT_04618 [Streptomyces sp. MnatMP-M77]|nr:hypothetical protein YW3DRAFT_04618 [Streptomyces sp. MnatMP-M77]SCD93568.1 hypothetical protein GA0115261_102436 [Streptomyces sp. OspMP-M43]
MADKPSIVPVHGFWGGPVTDLIEEAATASAG